MQMDYVDMHYVMCVRACTCVTSMQTYAHVYGLLYDHGDEHEAHPQEECAGWHA